MKGSETVFRKVMLLTLLAVVAAAVGICVWFFGVSQSSDTPPRQPSPTATNEVTGVKPLTLEEATRLANALTNQDQATYDAAWLTDNPPPLAPPRTKIVVDPAPGSIETNVKYGVGGVRAIVTMPDGRTIEVVISVELSGNRWLVHDMKEVK